MRVKVLASAAALLGIPAMLIAGVTQPAPAPEPATLLLLGGGLMTVGFLGWRHNHRK